MALYKDGRFQADPWRPIKEGEAAPAAGHVIFPLDWWLAERGSYAGAAPPLGLRIEPGVSIAAFEADLPRFALIALDFPKFADGRAFSTARLLRDRHGFAGELRAVGEVLFDQLLPMRRCGFDAFEIADPATEAALREGHAEPITHYYQPGRGPEAPAGARPWLRRATPAPR